MADSEHPPGNLFAASGILLGIMQLVNTSYHPRVNDEMIWNDKNISICLRRFVA